MIIYTYKYILKIITLKMHSKIVNSQEDSKDIFAKNINFHCNILVLTPAAC